MQSEWDTEYNFTKEDLSDLLFATIGMFLEWKNLHNESEENAKFFAVGDMLAGLDAARSEKVAQELRAVLVRPQPAPAA